MESGVDDEGGTMKTVNALDVRNRLGSILDELRSTGEPILVSKGRKLCAVLVTPEDFKTRFLDKQAEEDRLKLLQSIRQLRRPKRGKASSLAVLRGLRGPLK